VLFRIIKSNVKLSNSTTKKRKNKKEKTKKQLLTYSFSVAYEFLEKEEKTIHCEIIFAGAIVLNIFSEHDECKTKNSSEIAAKFCDSNNEVTSGENVV
jgi:hypothetical protein